MNINYRYVAPELEYVLSYTDARAVIVDGALERRIRAVARSVSTLRAVIVAGDRTDQYVRTFAESRSLRLTRR